MKNTSRPPMGTILKVAPLTIAGLAVWAITQPSPWAWAQGLRAVLFVLLLSKTCSVAINVYRGSEPASRLVVPVLICLEVLLVGTHIVTRLVGASILAFLDVGLLAFAIWTVLAIRQSQREANPEDSLERSLLRFFPRAFSRVAAIELTIVASAFSAFTYVWTNQAYDSRTYVETAKMRFLVFAMPIIVVPDLFFVHFVLARAPLSVKLVLDFIGIYSVLWVLGVFATMAARPHELDGDVVHLKRGILNHIDLPRGMIKEARPIERQRSFVRRKNAASLTVGGVGAVEIDLEEPLLVSGPFGLAPRNVAKLVVATDRPVEFCHKLLA